MNKFKKISVLTVAVVLILGGHVFAKTGVVSNTSQGLVLRGSASKSGEPLSTVAEGTKVEILEEQDNWYKVNADGKEGYLFAEYVIVQEETENTNTEETPQSEETDDVNSVKTETKIHLMPVISSTTVGTIPAEAELSIEKTVGNWNYVTYNNIKGWVRTATVSTVAEPAETPIEEEIDAKLRHVD